MDAKKMSFEKGSFDLVIDKGFKNNYVKKVLIITLKKELLILSFAEQKAILI